MLKWSTTRSNGRVLGEEIRKKLEEEKMELQSVRTDGCRDDDVASNNDITATSSVNWDLGSVASARTAGRKWKQIQRGGAES